MAQQPTPELFDGKKLPAGADESWWGGPSSADPACDTRNLNIPTVVTNQKDGPSATVTARPGDTVLIKPADGDLKAWGKVLGPNEPGYITPDEVVQTLSAAPPPANKTAEAMAGKEPPVKAKGEK